jgi:hypothetical protein
VRNHHPSVFARKISEITEKRQRTVPLNPSIAHDFKTAATARGHGCSGHVGKDMSSDFHDCTQLLRSRSGIDDSELTDFHQKSPHNRRIGKALGGFGFRMTESALKNADFLCFMTNGLVNHSSNIVESVSSVTIG